MSSRFGDPRRNACQSDRNITACAANGDSAVRTVADGGSTEQRKACVQESRTDLAAKREEGRKERWTTWCTSPGPGLLV